MSELDSLCDELLEAIDDILASLTQPTECLELLDRLGSGVSMRRAGIREDMQRGRNV